MEQFKFLKNSEIDDKLLKVVNDNIFTVMFCAKQMELDTMVLRHWYKVNDFSNSQRIFKMMMIDSASKTHYSDVREFHYIIYDGEKHISLKLEKYHNNFDIDIVHCKLATQENITTFINLENEQS
jgi:hypothetical protein